MNEQLTKFLEILVQPMALVGVVGQICFSSRFIVQWIASERRGESTVPDAFWYLSLSGGALVLIYAVWRHDPVFTVAQVAGLVVYVRNIVLVRRRKRQATPGTP
jgi:lipid-A-disaccharide synthase-like uncharacterized protein